MTDIRFIRILKYILPAAALLFCAYLAAQEEQKTFAVLTPAGNAAVTNMNKLAARDAMDNYLKGNGARVVDREKTDPISSRPLYQSENGIFADEDVLEIGRILRADYVLTSEIFKEDGEVRVTISMLDIDTGEKNTRSGGSGRADSPGIEDLAGKVTDMLLGEEISRQAQAGFVETARPPVVDQPVVEIPAAKSEPTTTIAEKPKSRPSILDRILPPGGGGGLPDIPIINPPGGGTGGTTGKVPNTGVTYEITEISEGNRVRIRFDNNSNATYTFNWRMDGSSNLKYTGAYGRDNIVPPWGTIRQLGQYQSTTIFLDRIESNRSHAIGRLVFD